jgi:hypothetical protein
MVSKGREKIKKFHLCGLACFSWSLIAFLGDYLKKFFLNYNFFTFFVIHTVPLVLIGIGIRHNA